MGLVQHRSGTGTPIVLVHGVGSHWRVWEPIIGKLATEHDVIAVDLPGFGACAPDGTVPSVAGLTTRVQVLFAELGLERPHVAGNSMGGAIALELARRGSVESATALSPVGFWTPRARQWTILSVRATRAVARRAPGLIHPVLALAPGRAVLFKQFFHKPWRLSPAAAIGDAIALAGSPATPEALQHFRDYVFDAPHELRGVPMTIAWGDHDYLVPTRQRRRARRMLPWARHVEMPSCGHVPFADDPELVAAVVLAGAREPARAA